MFFEVLIEENKTANNFNFLILILAHLIQICKKRYGRVPFQIDSRYFNSLKTNGQLIMPEMVAQKIIQETNFPI